MLDRRDLILAALALPPASFRAAAQGLVGAVPEDSRLQPSTANAPPSGDIGSLLARRVDPGRESLGYVAGIVDAGGRRLVAVGQSGADDARPLDGDSVFEIGSITKVFTALLLADMARRGEVALDDPVERYLPPEGRPRVFADRPITLLDLASYTSSLPRMPTNFRPQDRARPYADYTAAKLHAFLAEFQPQHRPGSHYEYANLGFGLLGHALALRAGRSYEELVVSRICDPLGLDDTRVALTPTMRQRLVPGHDGALQRVPGWDFQALAGAGALRSTANDLFRLLDACQDRQPSVLAAALADLPVARRSMVAWQSHAALGWFVLTRHADEVIWKDGGTGGYSSFIGYSTRTGLGAVVLANTASRATQGIGLHLLNSAYALPLLRVQTTVDPPRLAAYVGRYALTPDFVLTVRSSDGHLMVQATGQPEFEVFAESDTRFFYRAVDAQLTFEPTTGGPADAVILHQNGRDRRAVRVP